MEMVKILVIIFEMEKLSGKTYECNQEVFESNQLLRHDYLIHIFASHHGIY